MTLPAPPLFTVPQQEIIASYQRLRTLVAGPPPTILSLIEIRPRRGATISALNPARGQVGAPIEISGDELQSVRKVFFGTERSEEVEFDDEDGVVRATVPQIPPGFVRVAVETDCGTALGGFNVEAGLVVD